MKKKLKTISRLLFAALMLTVCNIAKGEVFWDFQLGGMPREITYNNESTLFNDTKETSSDLLVGFGLYIPLGKNSPWIIETGLRYRYALMHLCGDGEYTYSNYENGNYVPYTYNYEWVAQRYGNGHTLEIPIKIDYEWRWNAKNSLRFGMGVYGSYLLSTDEEWAGEYSYDNNGGFVVGIEPSITYSHRCVSFGFHYHNPLFYEQFDNLLGSGFTFTFALKFKSSAWKYIGMGVSAAATVGAGVAALYESTKGGDNSQGDSESYTSGSSSSSSSSKSKRDKNSVSEQQSFNTAKKAYSRYDDQLSGHFYGTSNNRMSCSEVKRIQNKMRQIREEWEARGKSFPKSDNETKPCS